MLYFTFKIPRWCKFTLRKTSTPKKIKEKEKKRTLYVRCASACAIEFWTKRTRACDVRAAENRVCECACVRGKKSSQLTD